MSARLSDLREVRSVSCSRYHWMEPFGVTPLPHHFSSLRNKWPASGSAAPVPPHCLSLLVFPPSKWVAMGKYTTPGALLPVLCLGAHPQGARQEAQASSVLDNSSSNKGWSQLEPGLPACFWMQPACSGTRGPAPLTVGERHFCHRSWHQDSWRAPIPRPESILSKVWAGAQRSCTWVCRYCRHHIHSDKKNTSTGALLTWLDIAGKFSNKTGKAITSSCCKRSRATLSLCPLDSQAASWAPVQDQAQCSSWFHVLSLAIGNSWCLGTSKAEGNHCFGAAVSSSV